MGQCRECRKSIYKSTKDCGHHFMWNGQVDYDICNDTCCDRFGSCLFFERSMFNEGDISTFKWSDLHGKDGTIYNYKEFGSGEVLCFETKDGVRYILGVDLAKE